MNYITNINNLTDLELDFEALYLEKRSPLGDFSAEEDIDCILGEKIVINSRKPKIEIRKVCFKTIIYTYFGNQRIINSMQCIIARSNVQNNQKNQNENFNIINFNYSESENFKLFVLTIYYEDAVFNINVYYTKKLIEDIETERKKVYMINVYIYIGLRTYLRLVSKYVYYMKFYDEKFSYSFFYDKEVISDDSIRQHFIATKLVSNLKSHMCNSLMNLEINFDYNKITMDDYINVVSVKASTLSAILVPWDYSNIKNSINTLLGKLKFDPNSKPKFVLCTYHLSYSIFDEQWDKKNFNMFHYVGKIAKIKEIFDGFELEENHEQQNYCLQICLFERSYTQYYYLFLPTHDLQLLYNGFNTKQTLLLFAELLEQSKINVKKTMPPKISTFYNYVIDEINQFSYIPVSVIISHLNNKHDRKLEFFIYIVIALKAKNYKRLTNFYETLDKEELELLAKLYIPRWYFSIEIFNHGLYNKIMTNLFFRTIHNLVCTAISECSLQISEMIGTKMYNKPKQICYLQCHKDFPVLNQKTIIQNLSAAN